MVQAKRFLLRLFFGVEIFLFLLIYVFGTQGLQVVLGMRKENGALSLEIRQLEEEVKALKKTILSWKKDPFYKERVAREQLHMARSGDEIYFLN